MGCIYNWASHIQYLFLSLSPNVKLRHSPPKFPLRVGSEFIWLPYKSIDKGLLRGLWVLPLKKCHTGKSLPSGDDDFPMEPSSLSLPHLLYSSPSLSPQGHIQFGQNCIQQQGQGE